CYIRYPLADFAFMKMLKKLQKICKVVVEIPTYPYDKQNKELQGVFSKYKIVSDKILRKYLKKYNFVFSVLDDEKSVFGVPCINISNGIDVDAINYIGDKITYGKDINLIAVALVQNDHGYDRIIEGLNIYYKNKQSDQPNVYFNIVGNGPAIPNLKELTEKYNLSDYVVFHGAKYGEELDKLFCNNNLAASILGGHRSGFKKTSVLKSREYCARGIPFIKSLPDDDFPNELDFCKTLPSDDSPIDINEIIDFYEYVKNKKNVSYEMREYAKENLTWEKQLKKVLDAIENE
ncbi:MAG: glycosyltransferase, partial [Clostridia bacterium]|nr:glycosyltransferase [Clostridia bacterium]